MCKCAIPFARSWENPFPAIFPLQLKTHRLSVNTLRFTKISSEPRLVQDQFDTSLLIDFFLFCYFFWFTSKTINASICKQRGLVLDFLCQLYLSIYTFHVKLPSGMVRFRLLWYKIAVCPCVRVCMCRDAVTETLRHTGVCSFLGCQGANLLKCYKWKNILLFFLPKKKAANLVLCLPRQQNLSLLPSPHQPTSV